jgi:hypothetical protein
MILAAIILTVLAAYLSIGLVFGLLFMLKYAAKLDPAAAGTSWLFRLLLWPGACAFWPWLLWRVRREAA